VVGARELMPGRRGLHSTVETLSARECDPAAAVPACGRYPRALVAGAARAAVRVAVSVGLARVAPPAESRNRRARLRICGDGCARANRCVVIAGAIVEASRVGGWFQRACVLLGRSPRRLST